MSIKQESDTVTGDLTKLEPGYDYIRDIKNDIEESFPQVKTECCLQEEDSTLPNTTVSQGQWIMSINAVVKEEVSTSNVSSHEEDYSDNTVLQPEKVTSVTPSYLQSSNICTASTDSETKSELWEHQEEFHEHSSQTLLKSEPAMSTDTNTNNESFVNEFSSQRHNGKERKRKHTVEKLFHCEFCGYTCKTSSHLQDHERKHAGYNDNIDLQQEKVTSVTPSYLHLQSLNIYITDADCKTKSVSFQHQNEFHEHSSQTVLESEPAMSTDTNTYNESFVSREVRDFQKFDPTADNLQPNQKEQVKLYQCGTCSYSCNVLFDLCQHKISHTKETFYVCDLCQTSYQYFLDLKCHLMSHAVNEFSSKRSTGQECKRKHPVEKLFLCEFCGYTCKTSSKLQDHKRKHTDEKPYSCDLCDFSCRHSNALKVHKRKHSGEKPYSCDLCGYSCRQSGNLQSHKRKHTGEKPYSCDLCDFTCRQSNGLKRHKRTHTGEKPYFCDLCDFTCRESNDLKRHKRTHTGEKPYSCDLCDYTCTYLQSLKLHKLKHTDEKPYSCDLCNYTCRLLKYLKYHKTIHTGEKSYPCDLCDHSCRTSSHLKEHKRKHTGEKPYSCDLCDYTCRHSGNLKKHKKMHTSEEPCSGDL